MSGPFDQVWTRQPQIATGVNWANPITQGLAALFDARNAREVISGAFASNRSSLVSAGRLGVGGDFSGTANQQYAHQPQFAVLGDITIVILCDIRTASGYTNFIAKQGTTITDAPYEFRGGGGSSADSQMLLLRANASTFSVSDVGSDHYTPPFSGVLAVSAPGVASAAATGWVNGRQSWVGGTSLLVPTDNGAAVWIGRRYDGATQLDGRIYYVALFKRVLSATEHASIAANPWQLFTPTTQPVWGNR